MKIIFIGDSLTYGYRVDEEKRWPNTIGEKFQIEILNRGELGDSTAGMLLRFYEEAIKKSPDIIIIMGGTNDFLMNCSVENVQKNIYAMIKEAGQYHIKVILGIQPPIIPYMAEKFWVPNVNYTEINEKISQYSEWVKDFGAMHNLLYIDFFNKFNELLKNKPPEEYYIDGLHLNSKGHEVMAWAASNVLDILKTK
ncbi:MAG: GDSL-type esterase/lipase family protein [Clostridium sp.]|nr:GDSL-type esterase/lipase family protein [Clostridium sp.]